jgi:hypothetical protein
MRSRLYKHLFLLFLGVTSLVLNACILDPFGDPLSAVTPDTTIPSTLQVTVNINEDQNASDAKSQVTLQFKTNEIKEDNYVIFTHGERVNCNDRMIALGNSSRYSVRIDIPPVYTCSYRWNGMDYTIFNETSRDKLKPELKTPVGDNPNFKVWYYPDRPNLICPIQVVASDSLQNINGLPVPDNQNIYVGPDVRSLRGTGSLVMTRTCVPRLNVNNPDDNHRVFNRVSLTYTSTATLSVTWFPPSTPVQSNS